MRDEISSLDDKAFHAALREGVIAVKGKRYKFAQRVLFKAANINPFDPRPWVWLAGTTTDPIEQKEYLEKALGLDPNNQIAQNGLDQLEQDYQEIFDEAAENRAKAHGGPQPSRRPAYDGIKEMTYTCPHCGGTVAYDISQKDIVCEYCGETVVVSEVPIDRAEDPVFHYEMLTEKAHNEIHTLDKVKCRQCGAHIILPQGQKTLQCPYCGTNRFQAPENLETIVPPHGIILFEINQNEAIANSKKWWGTGFFAPDDLRIAAKKLTLRPAYYPFWAFEGGLEVNWSCLVQTNVFANKDDDSSWDPRSGQLVHFFKEVVIPGIKNIPEKLTENIKGFDHKEIINFQPDHVVGWPVVAYDVPLSDASLVARRRITGNIRRQRNQLVLPGTTKKDVNINAGKWTGVTFQHILLPIWMGHYHYKGQEYFVLVNGQTGQVEGEKPVDRVKVWGLTAIIALTVILLGTILTTLFKAGVFSLP